MDEEPQTKGYSLAMDAEEDEIEFQKAETGSSIDGTSLTKKIT